MNIKRKEKQRIEPMLSVGIGCAIGLWFYDMNEGLQTSKAAFILFIGKINR